MYIWELVTCLHAQGEALPCKGRKLSSQDDVPVEEVPITIV